MIAAADFDTLPLLHTYIFDQMESCEYFCILQDSHEILVLVQIQAAYGSA